MVHNGIEYGDMQLICEAYSLLKHGAGLTNPELAKVFHDWNRGELDSYLIEITRDIFTVKDPDSGQFMVDLILDKAGAKGTGKWMSQLALDLGVPSTLVDQLQDLPIELIDFITNLLKLISILADLLYRLVLVVLLRHHPARPGTVGNPRPLWSILEAIGPFVH
jgi:hypothetical protein